ncbi:hypothetical protein MLD38_006032 [Melastoma candidum]|uniref:Uncharacterized protein n=1 Tax=Melastoma candidum TaxID=119954 RepID=A0ACB9RLN9_9MYRT|nr:hypothetical protein MLD38_006032 [Melastoma candidum]
MASLMLLLLWVAALSFPGICLASIGYVGQVSPGLEGSQMDWIDRNGLFLRSNGSVFAFGLVPTKDVTLFFLAVVHVSTQAVVWSANKDSPVSNSDKFVFGQDGNVLVQSGSRVVWETNTAGKGVASMELLDSGNLVLKGKDGNSVWQSFSYPTDTLLSSQEFVEGMRLVSLGSNNLSYVLEMKSGDLILFAAYETPQPYWTMGSDNRRVINQDGGNITSSSLSANSWKFYDQNKMLLWQFVFSSNTDANATWIAVLGTDGSISFTNLQADGSQTGSPTRIPADSCSTPQPCSPYSICYNSNMCRCVSALQSYQSCEPGIASPSSGSCKKDSFDLVITGEPVGYFALGFVSPTSTTDLEGCKASCLGNCSCLVMFHQNSTRSCYLLDDVGAFQSADNKSGFSSYIKVSKGAVKGNNNNSNNGVTVAIVISVVAAVIILGVAFGGFRWYKARRFQPQTTPPESSEEDTFLGSLGGMPARYGFKDLQTATNNFTTKLGQGGFGSVYRGVLPDGAVIAVKKLEGIGQGKKEFRAEVCIIGSIHHHHLVRLKGFCTEGSHRLLAYEYMANGSLDKWIFKKGQRDILDWETRFNIAVGTAKGLAYLHEDCDVKIVHCDIKPENVLLDENFIAKVSDFGLAKLMTREQSHVFTTLRGTRGYLAPEWITNYAISEKSDVYSYGMLLLEIIGGRKNYDPTETSERSHFPSYAFRKMEEGKLRDILDLSLEVDDKDERVYTAVKVALWCIQEDMQMRPPMTRVVQMLEGLCHVPQPPVSSPLGGRLYASLFKSSTSEGGTTSSGPSDCNSDAYLSAVRLSGPR